MRDIGDQLHAYENQLLKDISVPPVESVFQSARRRAKVRGGVTVMAVVSVVVGVGIAVSPWQSRPSTTLPAGPTPQTSADRSGAPATAGCAAQDVTVKAPAGEVSLDKLTGPLDVAFGDQVVIEAGAACQGLTVATQSGPGLDADPIKDQLLQRTQPGSQALVASEAGETTLRLIDNSTCAASTQCAGKVIGSLTINVSAAPAAPTAGGTVLEQIRGFLDGRTDLPVRLPTRLPGVAAGHTLSARATADRTSYQIRLYDCGVSLPLNDPGVGNLVGGRDCGGEAAMYGSFDAEQLATASAAQAALPSVATTTPTTPQCPAGGGDGETSSATLGSVLATVLSCPEVTRVSGPEVQVGWTQRGWTVMLLDGGATSFTAASREVAASVEAAVATGTLPAASGILEVNVGGDGEHTEGVWANGSVVYLAYNDHSAPDAVAMLSSVDAG